MWGLRAAAQADERAGGSEDVPDPVQQARQRRSAQTLARWPIDCSTSARSPARRWIAAMAGWAGWNVEQGGPDDRPARSGPVRAAMNAGSMSTGTRPPGKRENLPMVWSPSTPGRGSGRKGRGGDWGDGGKGDRAAQVLGSLRRLHQEPADAAAGPLHAVKLAGRRGERQTRVRVVG